MIQSRKRSLKEALTNTFVGGLLNIAVSQWYFIALGIPFPIMANLGLTVIMYFVSTWRAYVIRREYQKQDSKR